MMSTVQSELASMWGQQIMSTVHGELAAGGSK